MPLKAGDTVSIGVSPTIRVSRYDSLKPHVSITRQVGNDPEADVADMQRTLRALLPAIVLLEAGAFEEYNSLIDGGGTFDDLVAFCRERLTTEKVKYGVVEESATVGGAGGEKGKAVRRGPSRRSP